MARLRSSANRMNRSSATVRAGAFRSRISLTGKAPYKQLPLFGIGAFFAKDQVTVTHGSPTHFSRGSDSGSAVTFHFCGVRGSTVWWEPKRLPSMVGVAVGAFADPDFPAPVQASWDVRQHGWLRLPVEVASHPRSPARTAPRDGR